MKLRETTTTGEENGRPVESFLELIPLTKADAEGISVAITKCRKKKRFKLVAS